MSDLTPRPWFCPPNLNLGPWTWDALNVSFWVFFWGPRKYYVWVLQVKSHITNYNQRQAANPKARVDGPVHVRGPPREVFPLSTHTLLCEGGSFKVVSAVYPQRLNLQGIRCQTPFLSSQSRVAEWSWLHGCAYLTKAEQSVKGKRMHKGKTFSNPIGSFNFILNYTRLYLLYYNCMF